LASVKILEYPVLAAYPWYVVLPTLYVSTPPCAEAVARSKAAVANDVESFIVNEFCVTIQYPDKEGRSKTR
jgi:hypothetical protein